MEVHSIETHPTRVGAGNKRKNSYLDYYKTVLQKVSFDGNLFYKEYRKAINSLSVEEVASLKDWIKSHEIFYRVGSDIRSEQKISHPV